MELPAIAALLAPFLPAPLAEHQLRAIASYLNILLRWNARMNLTAVRDSQHIVTRHFGESLFAASHLLEPDTSLHAIDVGSGAGFPGLPLKIYVPRLRLTLIESHNKKATFLREVIRALALDDVEVFAGRAEAYLTDPDLLRRCGTPGGAELVTLRAVESFESALPVAASLLTPGPETTSSHGSRLALLIGAAQAQRARDLLLHFSWDKPVQIPLSSARVLLVGRNQAS